jgi:NADPH:quinone reductase-like Zn-dependent oxidoreductase
MKAYAIDDFGRPGSVRELPDPEPGEGQVRIRVAAAALNPFDVTVTSGFMRDQMEHRFPLVPGSDASGTIDALGPGVTDRVIGDEVFGTSGKPFVGEGSLAELFVVSVDTIAAKPDAVDHRTAAGIPVAGATALTMVEAARMAQGDVVVALGATGGVGSFLVQLAAKRGATVVAVASAPNADYARSLGAADVVDYYAAADVVEEIRSRYPDGITVIADMHRNGDTVARLAELVGEGGRVVSAVGSADPDALASRGIEAANVMGRVATDPLGTLAEMLERGELVAPDLHDYPLSGAAEALEAVGSGHTRGKIVVLPD